MSLNGNLYKLLIPYFVSIKTSISKVFPKKAKLAIDLDFLIRNEVDKNAGIFSFIQIGANDGVTRPDDIIKYAQIFETIGIMIEPQPDIFKVLQSNFANYPNIKLINKAIHNELKSMTLYRFAPIMLDKLPDIPLWARTNGIASFSRQHVIDHAKQLNLPTDIIEEINVDCISLDDLLSDIDFDPILLKIDVEGYDYEILNALNLHLFKPKIIHFESMHMEKSKYQSILSKFHSFNYRFIADKMDTTVYL